VGLTANAYNSDKDAQWATRQAIANTMTDVFPDEVDILLVESKFLAFTQGEKTLVKALPIVPL
jgi:hypothetical protein